MPAVTPIRFPDPGLIKDWRDWARLLVMELDRFNRVLAIQPVAAGGLSDGDKGDITVSGGGAAWAIDPDAVTYAKMQNMPASRLLGRGSSGGGDPEELTVGPGLAITGTNLDAVSDSSTQRVEVAQDGQLISTRKRINFRSNDEVEALVLDNPLNRADVEFQLTSLDRKFRRLLLVVAELLDDIPDGLEEDVEQAENERDDAFN